MDENDKAKVNVNDVNVRRFQVISDVSVSGEM